MANNTTKRDLRAWVAALNAVADLQEAIEQESEDYTAQRNWEWQDPYRAIVRSAMRTWPDRFKDEGRYGSANGLKHAATEALESFKARAKMRREEQAYDNSAEHL